MLTPLTHTVIVDLHLDPLDPPTLDTSKRHIRLLASDLGAQVDVLATGKDNLRASVRIMDVRIEDVTKQGGEIPPLVVLARTMPRSLVRPPPPPAFLLREHS